MAAVVSRILFTNRITAQGVALIPCCQNNALPIGYLRDQLPSKKVRMLSAWTISADNNRLNYKEGVSGFRNATIANGYYGTGVELAAAVTTAMNAVAVNNTYLVTYDASTHKFTIARATGAATVELLWQGGSNPTQSIGESLGFDVSADDTGLTTYVADFVAYQGTHFLRADLGSAQSIEAAIVWAHNAGTGGTFTHQAHTSDAWTAPDVSQVLAGDAVIRIAFFSVQTKRWQRLKINDVSNPLGFSEVGIWFAGPYTQPSVTFSDSFSNDPEELSALSVAIGGAHFTDQRAIRGVFNIEYSEVPPADLVLLQAIEAATPKGKNFFFAFDPINTPADTVYGFRAGPMRQQYRPGIYWTVSFQLAEALE
jgi:hypothetical protein